MGDKKIKVLFVAGSGRSGTTILQNILGQIDGFYSVGEVRSVWERGFLKNQTCACGDLFHECEWWKNVKRQSPDVFEKLDAARLYHLTESFRIQDLPSTLLPGGRNRHLARLDEYMKMLEELYASIQSATGSRVIVDDSKNPSYGYLVSQLPSIDLHILHFVRDARSVAYSWAKKKPFDPGPNPAYMTQKGPVKSSLQWYARNVGTEVWLKKNAAKYMQMRYEDFVANPKKGIEQMLQFVGETADRLPFVSDERVEIIRPNHSIFGNIVRFQRGMVDIKLDTEWKSKMSGAQKAVVTLLTWPLLLRYGYLGSGSSRGESSKGSIAVRNPK